MIWQEGSIWEQNIVIDIAMSDVGVSSPIVDVRPAVTITLEPHDGLSTIEYSLDKDLSVWREWAKGQVGSYSEDVLIAPVTGLRVRVISGTANASFVEDRFGRI
jgi:hypothetical protein